MRNGPFWNRVTKVLNYGKLTIEIGKSQLAVTDKNGKRIINNFGKYYIKDQSFYLENPLDEDEEFDSLK